MAVLPSLAGGAAALREAEPDRGPDRRAAPEDAFASHLEASDAAASPGRSASAASEAVATAEARAAAPSQPAADAASKPAPTEARTATAARATRPGQGADDAAPAEDEADGAGGEADHASEGSAHGVRRGRKPTAAHHPLGDEAGERTAALQLAPQPGIAKPAHPGPTAGAGTDDAEAGTATAAAARSVARAIGQGARLAHADRQGAGLASPAAHGRASESRPAPPSSAQPNAALEAALAHAEGNRPAATGTPAGAASAAQATRAAAGAPLPELPQTSLSGAIQLGSAHLRLESSTLGDLALHVRVRGGVAHVRVEGEQATQVAARGLELERALAAQGLTLGRLEAEPPAQAPAPAAQASQARTDGQGSAGHDGAAGQQPQEDRPGPQDGPAAPPAPQAPAGRRAAARPNVHHVEA